MRLRGKLTEVGFSLILTFFLLFSGGPVMAQSKADPAIYYLSMAGNGSFWTLRINDMTVWSDFSGEDVNLTLPVNNYLKDGTNDISLTFVSVAGEDQAENVANPDFYFLAEIERLDEVTRERKRATLVNLGLDAQNEVTFPATTRFNQPVVTATSAPMLLAGTTVERSRLVRGWDKPWDARRVQATFEIADPMPDFPWAAAPVLEETPQLRAQVLAAYRQLHTILSSANAAQVTQAYGPAWTHVAAAMNYASVEDYIKQSRALADLAPADESGKTLQPLDLVRGESNFELDFMANGRLVRIIPDPLIWTSQEQPDEVKSSNVVFFMGPDGQLRIGSVVY